MNNVQRAADLAAAQSIASPERRRCRSVDVAVATTAANGVGSTEKC